MKHLMSLAIVAALSCAAFAAHASPAGHPAKSETVAPDKPHAAPASFVLEAPRFHYESAFVIRCESEPAYAPTVCPPALDVRHWNVPVIARHAAPFIPLAKATARSSI